MGIGVIPFPILVDSHLHMILIIVPFPSDYHMGLPFPLGFPVSHAHLYCAETAEVIDLPFGLWTLVGALT